MTLLMSKKIVKTTKNPDQKVKKSNTKETLSEKKEDQSILMNANTKIGEDRDRT